MHDEGKLEMVVAITTPAHPRMGEERMPTLPPHGGGRISALAALEDAKTII